MRNTMHRILIIFLSLMVLCCNQPKEAKKPKVILAFKIETDTKYERTLIDSNLHDSHVDSLFYNAGNRDSLYIHYVSKNNYPLKIWSKPLVEKFYLDSLTINSSDKRRFGALYVGSIDNREPSDWVKIRTPSWEFDYSVYHPNKYRFMIIRELDDSTSGEIVKYVEITMTASYFQYQHPL